ncbi:MAG: single-stranded DNA-binding protein [Flavobacterium sp.]|nr:single-stranded DNA-binding protein [Flavobacterium sp.]
MQTLTIVGHVGNDAEVKDLGTTQVINFSLAVTEKIKNENVTTWYKCAYFSNNVAIAPWLTKGSLIGLTGKPEIEIYKTGQGETKANLKCIVANIKLYSSTKERTAPQQPTQQDPAPVRQPMDNKAPTQKEEEPDDLPF